MAGFDDTLRASSLAILKRELTENERLEFLDLAGAIGMNNVEDYLYMLMIFKRNEDKINGQLLSFRKEMKAKFEEMGALEKKIDATLENSIGKILTEGAQAIGQRMVGHIEAASSRVFGANSDFHYLRGQLVIVCVIAFLMTLAYWLGGAGVFDFDGGRSYFTMFLWLPAGGLAIAGGLVYTLTWYLDHEGRIGHYPSYGINLGLQIFILLMLLLRVLL